MSELLLRGTAWLSLLAWAGSEWARTGVDIMFVNGAFVFVRGPVRWLGAAALIVVLAAWYRRAGAGTTDG
jgi:hypothetical protein